MEKSSVKVLRLLVAAEVELRIMEENCQIDKNGENVVKHGQVLMYSWLCHTRDTICAALQLIRLVQKIEEAEG